jgi:archaellum biogenesis protein FlaJ (TadC family)
MKTVLIIILSIASFVNLVWLFCVFGFMPEDPIIITDVQKLKSAQQGLINVTIFNFVLWFSALLCMLYIKKKEKRTNGVI